MGGSEVLPPKKGVRKSFSHAGGGGGGGTRSFQVFLTRQLGVLAILKEGTQSFHPLKEGVQQK